MSSRIEEVIEEIEEFIDSCKPSAFSSSKIVVNRDELDTLLEELKSKTPEEIKRYQKIINNKEAILADAQAKADSIIAQAQIQTNELVSEHQIMQQAYAQANEVVNIATKQAQDMLDKASEDANNIRTGAIQYTDDLLSRVQQIVEDSLKATNAQNAALLETIRNNDQQYSMSMNGYLDIIRQNRNELVPGSQDEEIYAQDNMAQPASEEEFVSEEAVTTEESANVEETSAPADLSGEEELAVPDELFS